MPIICPFKVDLPPPRPLHEIIFEHFDQYGDKVALEEDNGPDADTVKLTFNEIRQLAFNAANNLHKLGFRKNDVIAVYLENRVHYAPLLLAVSALGGALTGVNPLYTAEELQRQLADSGSKFVITRRLFFDKVKQACLNLPASQIKHVILVDGVGSETSNTALVPLKEIFQGSYTRMPLVQIDPKEDVVILPYSSGTTGLPKGVMLTHANLSALFFARFSLGAFRVARQQDVSVMFMPFFHMTGFFGLISVLYNGNKGIVMPRFDAVRYVQLIAQHKATVIFCVPSVLVFLTRSKEVDKYDLSNVRAIGFGAAPAGKELIEAVKKRFPHISVIQQGYGMTESGGVSTVNPGLSAAQYLVGSCGIPVPNTEIKVISIDGKNTELGPMQTGEICMRGPGIMKGYINNEKATRETIDADGWLHSGDLGYYDFFAHVYIVDRLKELIKYKAFQVAPAELEDTILKHSAVQEVGVVGIPDPKNPDVGELPTAFVVLKPGQVAGSKTEESIKALVAEHLSPYKHLRGGVRFCEELPKGPSGKIMRRELKLGKVKLARLENVAPSKL